MSTQAHGVFGVDLPDDVPGRLRFWSFVMVPGFFIATAAASLLGAWFMRLLAVPSGGLLTSAGVYGWTAAMVVTAIMAAAPVIGIRLACRAQALKPCAAGAGALITNACALLFVVLTTALTWYLGSH